MNIALTQAELGEAMRRLAAMEGHTPNVERLRPGPAPSAVVAERRALARQLRDQGLRLAKILPLMHERGYPVSMATLKADLALTL